MAVIGDRQEDDITMASAPATRGRAAERKMRTRERLVEAARTVFTRDGFYESQIAAIPAEAGMSTGTFYNYFTSKEEVFHAVMHMVIEELTQRSPLEDESHADLSPAESIHRANRSYLLGYRRNAQLMKTCVFLAASNPDIGEIKAQFDRIFEERLMNAIARWQEQGIVPTNINTRYMANALAYMVDRFASEFYIFGKPYDEDTAVDVLTDIWTRALGIVEGHG